MKIIHPSLILALIVTANAANADVVLSKLTEGGNPNWPNTAPHLFISGKINKGDYERALNAVNETYNHGEISDLFVQLDSPGGDVLEAMKIGSLVRKLKLTTMVIHGQCSSACVFILVAGAERLAPSGVIGIHRPFFEKEYFSGLPADEAQNKYEKMTEATNGYLAEMGVAKELIEKMFRIPSNEVVTLSFADVLKWISGSPASLDEWLIAKCGSYTKDESNDYISMWVTHEIKLKPGYANYLKEKVSNIDGCRRTTLADERSRIAAMLFSAKK